MSERHLKTIAFDEVFGRQMRFIAGPRQVGKTTLAKRFLKEHSSEKLYYNWDLRKTKDRFFKEPYFYHDDALKLKSKKKKWVCFDEIHKYPKWKNILKDAFDSFENKYQFIITGSARLDMFRRSGDALTGRYFLFRLMPLTLSEITKRKLVLPDQSAQNFIETAFQTQSYQKDLESLLKFSGFPEPLTKGNEVFSSNWHESYLDTLVKEDLRDLTRIHELENIIRLIAFLPERIGSPLSLNSLKEDLQVSYNAVRSYVRGLYLTHVLFAIPPYSKKFKYAVTKEQKVYFYDWSLIKNESRQFENYVACELKNWVQLWSNATKHKFDLFFIRMRDKKETDFLVTKDQNPFFLVEAKLSSENIDFSHIHHAEQLGQIPFVQIVKKKDILKTQGKTVFVVSASRFF